MKKIKRMNQNTKQNKRKQNHKVEFFTTEKIEVVRMEVNLHYFPMASENFTRDYQSNKLFKLRTNKLTR